MLNKRSVSPWFKVLTTLTVLPQIACTVLIPNLTGPPTQANQAIPNTLDASVRLTATQIVYVTQSGPTDEAPETDASPSGPTFFVAPSGSDSNNGSAASPWATIQHAVDNVNPGATILVQSGTYLGARIESSGAAAAPITLMAASGAQVILDGPGPDNVHESTLELENWDASVAYWVISGLEVTGAPNWGIDIRGGEEIHSHHITVRSNRVHDNGLSSGKTGIFAAFSDDILIEGNQSYNNGEHGIYINNSSDRFTVRGNNLHHNANSGLHLNGDLSMGGDGILSDGLVENNIIYENGATGGAAINMDGVANTILRNNLLYNNHASGIAVFQQDGAVCSQNNRLLQNTILMPDDGRWAITIGSLSHSTAQCTNNQVLNNIIYSAHSYRGSITLVSPSQTTGLLSDYNVVVDRFSIDEGDSVISLAEWQALGYDAHSLIAAPVDLFVNPTTNDYHLPQSSPAVDNGASIPDVTGDLEGKPRPSGSGYDIGAYEYQVGGGIEPSSKIYLPLVVHAASTSNQFIQAVL